ncbi:MAG TPA: palindromic element RPE4 domain-containing protein [Rickettsia endosymbiont of Bembidion nr. Transversale]|nr:palindromic element RPE4 domain-containing protein [Rickettsia endosymbiont of Bembidion nr. Transversale]
MYFLDTVVKPRYDRFCTKSTISSKFSCLLFVSAHFIAL